MHIVEYFNSLSYRNPTLEELRYLAPTLGFARITSPKLRELTTLHSSSLPLDQYFSDVIGPIVDRCDYVNYPLSVLINFLCHQLTMRRFQSARSQRMLQVGCFTGEELFCGMVRNVSVVCDLITEGTPVRSSQDISWKAFAWEGDVSIIVVGIEKYLQEVQPNIGALVLANLKTAERYIEVTHAVWNALDDYGDLLACGTYEAMEGLAKKVAEWGGRASRILDRPDGASNGQDRAILVAQRRAVDYGSLISSDLR